jgi:hypothetical protein
VHALCLASWTCNLWALPLLAPSSSSLWQRGPGRFGIGPRDNAPCGLDHTADCLTESTTRARATTTRPARKASVENMYIHCSRVALFLLLGNPLPAARFERASPPIQSGRLAARHSKAPRRCHFVRAASVVLPFASSITRAAFLLPARSPAPTCPGALSLCAAHSTARIAATMAAVVSAPGGAARSGLC